ncbi:MAG: molybdopterin-guanine dinucleotide biosynthesis protein B [Rhodospirillaceae bacterium]|nr:molybdopterin-guanine dinucleotide biosynthesis protein B [Rhodospirillaceae bacterium]MBT7956575.1 molybdopterin-guanine dinucleotide biosynthesis protein B [Rhodospirillaceae bacterium]
MKIFGLAGWSGSGKTTLIVKLIPEFVSRGLAVSTMKHAHHEFDIDVPGKDSYEHRQAGASEVMISASQRWALMHEVKDEDEPSIDELIARMTPVDLLLVEGFKWHSHPKMEIHRPAVGKPLLQTDDPEIIAVASDGAIASLSVPVLDLNDVKGIADFILERCSLKAA